jgi:hypothetical protein
MNEVEREAYLIDLRREKVQSLLACGVTQVKIAQALHCSEYTISTDVAFLKAKARDYVADYEQHFAAEYKQCIDFISMVMLESWTSAKSCKYERHKPQFLNTTKDCLLIKAQLISDIGLIDRTVSYLEGLKKKKRTLVGLRENIEDTQLETIDTTTPPDTDAPVLLTDGSTESGESGESGDTDDVIDEEELPKGTE